jgi:hypothetical protein
LGVERISEAEGVHAAGPSIQQSPMDGGPPIAQPRGVRASSRPAVAPRSHPIAASRSLSLVRRRLRGLQSASALRASSCRSAPRIRATLVFHARVAAPVRTIADRSAAVPLRPSHRAAIGRTAGPPYLISSTGSASSARSPKPPDHHPTAGPTYLPLARSFYTRRSWRRKWGRARRNPSRHHRRPRL